MLQNICNISPWIVEIETCFSNNVIADIGFETTGLRHFFHFVSKWRFWALKTQMRTANPWHFRKILLNVCIKFCVLFEDVFTCSIFYYKCVFNLLPRSKIKLPCPKNILPLGKKSRPRTHYYYLCKQILAA